MAVLTTFSALYVLCFTDVLTGKDVFVRFTFLPCFAADLFSGVISDAGALFFGAISDAGAVFSGPVLAGGAVATGACGSGSVTRFTLIAFGKETLREENSGLTIITPSRTMWHTTEKTSVRPNRRFPVMTPSRE